MVLLKFLDLIAQDVNLVKTDFGQKLSFVDVIGNVTFTRVEPPALTGRRCFIYPIT